MLLAFVVVAGIARAGEVKYPPYPDFWGRELPVPEELAHTTSTRIFDNPDGDRLIRFVFDWKPSSGGIEHLEWWTLTFFGGALKRIDAEQSERISRAYWGTGRLYKHSEVDKITFANGDVLSRGNRDFGGKRCWSNYSNTLVKKDSSGRIIFNKMLFSYSDKPTRVEIWESCDIAGEKNHYFAWLSSIYPHLVPLEDETFLALAPELIIRFKPNLTSPFVDNQRLFLVDTTVIDRLVEEAYARPGQAIQNANDAIRDYLLTLKKEID
jgi:hypothetical protein